MNTKTKAAQKVVQKKSQAKRTKKAETVVTKEDAKLLDDTLNMVKSLNQKISTVSKAKTKLQKDVSELSRRIDSKDKNQTDDSKLKDEIIEEFKPIFNKLNPQTLKTQLNKEINSSLKQEIEKAKSQVKSDTKKGAEEISKKVAHLEKDLMQSIKSNEKLKNELNRLSNSKLGEDIFIGVEKKIREHVEISLRKISKEISELRVNPQGHQDKSLNNKISNIEKSLNKLEKELKKTEDKTSKSIQKEVENIKKKILSDLKSKDLNHKRELEVFKIEVSKHIRALLDGLHAEYNLLKEKAQESQMEEEKFLEEVAQGNLDRYELFSQRVDKAIKSNKETEEKLVELTYNNKVELENIFAQQIKEDLAQKTISNNEFLLNLKKLAKEKQEELSENIDNKLVNSVAQFEGKFHEYMQDFDKALKEKEKEFLEKLKVVENERYEVISQMEEFKEEISKLTKEYMANLHDELERIKKKEVKLGNEKNQFLVHINESSKARKLEIEDLANQMKDRVKGVLEEERDAFDRHEETFRGVFYEKVQNLHDFSKKKLENIERKFVDKNLKYVSDKINSMLEPLRLLEESVNAKEGEISKLGQEINSKQEVFLEDFHSHQKNLNQDFTKLEKKLNEKLEDSDKQIIKSRSVVKAILEEVEFSMTKMDNLINSKIEEINAGLNRLKSIESRLVGISQIDYKINQIESNMNNMHGKINEIENLNHTHGFESLNLLVSTIGEYEQNLIALVKSLKSEGVSEEHIKTILRQKGHPMLYVSMVLENLNFLEH